MLRNPLWCLVEQGNHKKWKCRDWTWGSFCAFQHLVQQTLTCLFTPKISSSVAIESATVKIRYLHLFQIISFTLNCLCKLYKVSYAQAWKMIPQYTRGHHPSSNCVYFHEKITQKPSAPVLTGQPWPEGRWRWLAQVQMTSRTVACIWRLLSPDLRCRGRLQGFALGLLRGSGLLPGPPFWSAMQKGHHVYTAFIWIFFFGFFFLSVMKLVCMDFTSP